MKSQAENSADVSHMATMFCVSGDQLGRYVECRLANDEAELLESHLNECDHCRAALATVVESGIGPNWLNVYRESTLNLRGSGVSKSAQFDETLIHSSTKARESLAVAKDASQRYRFERQIGEGGMGVVWEGTDTVMRRRVALKCLKSTGNLQVLGPRLLQEAASLARLSHPNIVAVFEVFSEDTRPTLVMEYVDGPTLSAWRSGRIVDERQAAVLMEQLARAVQHAHENGVVHRDLKPSNILLSIPKDGQSVSDECVGIVPKLSDFGLARILDDQHLTQTGDMLGTPAYMAPEQTLGVVTAIGPAADVYGLGAILYDLLTGTPPHVAHDPVSTLAMVRDREPVAPRLMRPELSKDLETICLKCLRKAASDRYASAGDLAADLKAYLEGHVIKARPLGRLATTLRWCRRHRLLTAAFSVSLVSLIALVVGSLQFASAEHTLREKADHAAMLAGKAEKIATEEARRADEMRALIKKNYDVSMNAVSTLVQLSGLGGEVIDLDELRATALREGTNVFKTFVDSLPEPEQWTQSDALAVAQYLDFAQRQPEPIDPRPWLEKLASALDRLESENADSPDRFIARQKHAREMAILAQKNGNNEDAAFWWEKAGRVQESVVQLDPENSAKYYRMAQAMMNAALYHSYCGHREEAARFAEKSVTAYRRILEIEGQLEKHKANFVEKLYWQARFERENGNPERSAAIEAEAAEHAGRFAPDSSYGLRLQQSKSNILGK